MPVTQALCKLTKTYKGKNGEIQEFVEGKTYRIVDMGCINVTFVISESGYKQPFDGDYYTYFSDVYSDVKTKK